MAMASSSGCGGRRNSRRLGRRCRRPRRDVRAQQQPVVAERVDGAAQSRGCARGRPCRTTCGGPRRATARRLGPRSRAGLLERRGARRPRATADYSSPHRVARPRRYSAARQPRQGEVRHVRSPCRNEDGATRGRLVPISPRAKRTQRQLVSEALTTYCVCRVTDRGTCG
jgi:hypothetical protein